ncbi:hypothetical protein NDU88_001470 [Pleurodeles waltl]|uniref:Uncharacterized protein n=1 Tax=Pleurodeles waltl TaxID=8319 RepID=A0AAV7NEA8_PLEWA|nr:hypothetical protein NDU88_001470 [Pleurodeles waltl]
MPPRPPPREDRTQPPDASLHTAGPPRSEAHTSMWFPGAVRRKIAEGLSSAGTTRVLLAAQCTCVSLKRCS